MNAARQSRRPWKPKGLRDGRAVQHNPECATFAIRKLLGERPDIRGVTLPGMPMGSPGMEGAKEASFEILEIRKSGGIGAVYAREQVG
jgi:hypothetical protein